MMMLRRFLATVPLVCALALTPACHTHTATPLPGKLDSRLFVDHGLGEIAGRVIYLDYARSQPGRPAKYAVPNATITLLDLAGKPVPEVAGTSTNARGRFGLYNVAIGEPYFVRATLVDPAGNRRNLYAFCRPEGKYTCIEISLASTIVAQKLAQDLTTAANFDAKKIAELTKQVEEALLKAGNPQLPPAGPLPTVPLDAPPPGGNQPPTPPPGIGDRPGSDREVLWIPFPGGDGGTWWAPGSGTDGGAWYVPPANDRDGYWWTPPNQGTDPTAERDGCGCVYIRLPGDNSGNWFRPDDNGNGGSWWINHPGGGGTWVNAGADPEETSAHPPSGGGTGAPPLGTGDSGGYIYIELPDGNGGHWWAPGSSGTGGSWWVPNGGDGYWYRPIYEGGAPPGDDDGPCGCSHIQFPGSNIDYWFRPDASGGGGSWWVVETGGGGSWVRFNDDDLGGGSRPPARELGGGWLIDQPPPGSTGDTVFILVPGGGSGYWYRPGTGGGNGAWWVTEPGGGGHWYEIPIYYTGGHTPPPPPGGHGPCGCLWVEIPGTDIHYFFLPGESGGGGSWWIVDDSSSGGHWWTPPPARPSAVGGSGGGEEWPTGNGGRMTLPPGGTSVGGGYYWIMLPGGGGGYWWLPSPDNPGGSWWISTGSGGYWWTPPAGHHGAIWIPLPDGDGHWFLPLEDGAGCWWVPLPGGGGYWVYVILDGSGRGGPLPPFGPLGPLTPTDIQDLLERLLGSDSLAGAGGGNTLFDRLVSSSPPLRGRLDEALDTFLNVNVVILFKGVNRAPFPLKDDPRFLLRGQVELGCTMMGPTSGNVVFAFNGQPVCEGSWQSDGYRGGFDSRTIQDGDYFLTAHEKVEGRALGRMLAKGYARVKNSNVEEIPCDTMWNDGL